MIRSRFEGTDIENDFENEITRAKIHTIKT